MQGGVLSSLLKVPHGALLAAGIAMPDMALFISFVIISSVISGYP